MNNITRIMCYPTVCQSARELFYQKINVPAHKILVLIAYPQKPPSNDHADVSSGAMGLILYYVRSGWSGETVISGTLGV